MHMYELKYRTLWSGTIYDINLTEESIYIEISWNCVTDHFFGQLKSVILWSY